MATSVVAQCPDGQFEDCNGYCVPLSYAQDSICDDGTAQEFPEGSGYYVDLSCQEYWCDIGNCSGCDNPCDAGFLTDCNGNCVPVTFIGDGVCDMGQRSYNGVPVDFSCQTYACDLYDCSGDGPCHEDGGHNGLDDPGACCISEVCSETTRRLCLESNGTFMGANTLCQTGTCDCGAGWTTDCLGNCILFEDIQGISCSADTWLDYGDGPFLVDVDCLELACNLSNCLGVCPGACCVGGGCEITSTYQECLDIEGLFLGSYVSCNEGSGCLDQQKPIQLPNNELEWSGALGTFEFGPQWIATGGDILIAGGAVTNSTWDLVTGVIVYRFDVDQWVEEALLEMPSGGPAYNEASYATDGTRIVVGSYEYDGTGQRMVLDIFAYNDKTEGWEFEQTIDDGYASPYWHFGWGKAIAIDGDKLVVGDSTRNDLGDNNGGGAHVYTFTNSEWILEQTLEPFGTPPYPDGEDQYLGMSVALEGDTVALNSESSILIYDISTNPAIEVQHLRNMKGTAWSRHRSMDLNAGRLMTNVVYADLENQNIVSKIYEQVTGVWVQTAELQPFDTTLLDSTGYIVDLEGDLALITSPTDSDLGIETGSAYMWKHDGSEWVFQAKLWSDRAVGGDLFGSSAALHGNNAYLSGKIDEPEGDNIKEFWPRGIAWINPLGGNISDDLNWDPIKPTVSDTVSFSLRSQTSISVDEAFPFVDMFIGPGKYSFDLQGIDRTLGAGGEAINIQGVPGFGAELKFRGGILQVNGDLYVGEDDLPGKLSLGSNDAGVMAQVHINGLYQQHDGGVIQIEIATGRDYAPAQATGVSPLLNGILELNLADGYLPQDGDLIPLMSSEFVNPNTGQFSMVLVNDPLPDGLYIKLNYIETDGSRDFGGTIYAEVDQLANLFGYGDPNSEEVAGTATDVLLTDIGSSTRTADGYDDIVVTTTDAVHVFLSDGSGGISSQATYNDSGFTSLAAVDSGDLDGDGTNDLVVVNSTTDQFIPIFNESNDITLLTIGTAESTGPNPTDVIVMNTDADSDDDVIIACKGYSFSDGEINFFNSVPALTGVFTADSTLPSPGSPGKIDPGDVNNDKGFHIYVSLGMSNSVSKANQMAGTRSTWQYTASSQVPIGPQSLVSGDINNDSIEDVIVVSPESDTLSILRGLPSGDFADPLQLFVGDEPNSITLLDFDNDGDLDIAVIATSITTGNRVAMIYRNDTSLNGGNLMFALDSTYDDGANPVLIASGKLDNDDFDDLVSVSEVSSYRGTSGNVIMRKAESSPASCSEDFDGNSEVNVLDLLTLIAAWEATGSNPEDLDGNGVVNVLDLLILIAA
ncbi:MAG: FG-GAP-like repeat-containing protein, partial [Phycisphaerales bacterium]|nr:FG-GAP-like repeat-containing protein [Phycisphaerales bacterium]